MSLDLCRILLVDDEAIILEGYQKLFDWNQYGCEVVGVAMDGEEAVQKAGELKPDIVIMDINLPKMNGLEAIKEIQDKAEEGRQIYIVIVTGYDDFSYCREALRLRVSDFILKPIDFDNLGIVIKGLVEKVMSNPRRKKITSGTMRKITEWMEEHLEKEDMSLTLLAEQMNMNPTYISQLFKKEMGIGYHTYLNQIRVEKACRYLTETDAPITSVAELVGFSDYRVFTKVFKSFVGKPPSQFRKNIN